MTSYRPGNVDWAEHGHALGQEPDLWIARRLGVTVGTVTCARRHRGIAPFRRPLVCRTCGAAYAYAGHGRVPVRCEACREARPHEAVQGHWTQRDWSTVPLGATWDTVIAEQMGCTVTSVCDARKRRGIAPYAEQRTCPCGNSYVAHVRRQRCCSAQCASVYGCAVWAGCDPAVALVRVALSALHRDMYGDGRIGRSDWSKR